MGGQWDITWRRARVGHGGRSLEFVLELIDTIWERSLISNGRGLLALTSDLIRIARVRESTS